MDHLIKKNSPRLTIVALSILQSSALIANPVSNSPLDMNSVSATNYQARGTGQFLAGSHQQLGGFADAMLPIWKRPDQIVYVDGTVLLGQEQTKAFSGGLGFRKIKQGGRLEGIWGLYTFVDSYHTNKSNNFVQLNPGVEWLGLNYEARLQGYIPLNGQTKAYQNALASSIPNDVAREASQLTSNFFGAKGRRIFDTNVALVEQIGPGVELEVGKSFPFHLNRFHRAEQQNVVSSRRLPLQHSK